MDMVIRRGHLQFHLNSRCDQRSVIIITTGLVLGERPRVLGDAKITRALLDRLSHHGEIIGTGDDRPRIKNSACLLIQYVLRRCDWGSAYRLRAQLRTGVPFAR